MEKGREFIMKRGDDWKCLRLRKPFLKEMGLLFKEWLVKCCLLIETNY
jgi:hypothetical protein